MLVSDPIRLAFRPAGSAETPVPTDGGPPLGPDEAIPIPGEISFGEVMEGLNPLHHLPGVGMIYRMATGTEIHPAMRVLGAGITGGPLGMALAGVMSFIEMTEPVARLRATMNGEADPLAVARPEPPARSVAEAYAQWGRRAGPQTATV